MTSLLTRGLNKSKEGSQTPLSEQEKTFKYTGIGLDGKKVSGIVKSTTRGKVQYQLEETG